MQKTNNTTVHGKLGDKIASLHPWYHNLHLNNGVQTAPDHPFGDFPTLKWDQFKDSIPANLDGWSALDIGCNAGFYSFELAKRGADVLGIDMDPHYLKQARWAARELGLQDKTKFRQLQVYDLAGMKRDFDIVLFMGVFYHLRYPMLALDIVSQKINKLMVFQTLTIPGTETLSVKDLELDQRTTMLEKGWPVMAFIEQKLAGDPTNWWAPNHACILSMLSTCGLRTVANPGNEIYIVQPDKTLTAVAQTWNRSEYLSATGKDWSVEIDAKLGGNGQ